MKRNKGGIEMEEQRAVVRITVPQAQEHLSGLRLACAHVEKAKRVLEGDCHEQVIGDYVAYLECLAGDLLREIEHANNCISNAEVQL